MIQSTLQCIKAVIGRRCKYFYERNLNIYNIISLTINKSLQSFSSPERLQSQIFNFQLYYQSELILWNKLNFTATVTCTMILLILSTRFIFMREVYIDKSIVDELSVRTTLRNDWSPGFPLVSLSRRRITLLGAL